MVEGVSVKPDTPETAALAAQFPDDFPVIRRPLDRRNRPVVIHLARRAPISLSISSEG